MRIEPGVEEPLRRSIVAVVDKDASGILPPLEHLDEKRRGLVVGYAGYVVGSVMNRVFEGDVDAEAADVMAETLVERESQWVDVGSQDEVGAFLLACAKGGDGLGDVDPDDPLRFTVVIAGYLLAHYRPKNMRWFEYLDQIWNDAESQPDPA